jgi:hypothetical protein
MHLNLMNQAVDAYTMTLAANRPRVLITTKQQQFKPFAKRFEIGINNMISEIGLEYTLKQWVMDAFFCMGIIKVHLADSGQVELEPDLWMDPGTPFASNVSLDNWVHDVTAPKYEQVKFAGDSYRMSFKDVTESGIYKATEDLQPTSKVAGGGDERLDAFASGTEVDADEFEPMIDLCDIWIPQDNMIYTFAVSDRNFMQLKGEPLAEMEWNGPEFGPYHLLGFNDVPQNIMPTSPASHLASLNRIINNIMRKQARRARNTKKAHTYPPSGDPDAKKLAMSSDDDWVQVTDPSQIGEVQIGGVDPNLQAFMIDSIDKFDRMAGNLTAMMGLGVQADTATQENLIHKAASKKEGQMSYKVLDGTRAVIRDLGQLLWNDEFKILRGELAIPGTDMVVQADWTPEDREGNFLDYNFDIDIFSMPYQSPGQRVQSIMQFLTQIYFPAIQEFQAQGANLNAQLLTEIMSDLSSTPRIRDLIQFSSPSLEQDPGPQTSVHPGNTTSTSTRQNIPTGGTTASRSTVAQQAWLGQSPNPDQIASMNLPPA